ncbi:MAG: galactose-1-phosphate uridylyltransferase [Actinomycetota bacterium]
MGTLRQDPTTGGWVILAPERSGRPAGMRKHRRADLPFFEPACPFCPGNEHMTPPEIARVPGEEQWRHRVVPNRFPALSADVNGDVIGDGHVREMGGLGAHEVVIETPLHDERLDEMDVDRIGSLLCLWRDRAQALSAEPWVRAVVIFKNFGDRAGTTLDHPHSQIMATAVCPPELRLRADVAERYLEDGGKSVYSDVLEDELETGERLVAVRDSFAAITPFASRAPFETWILPREQQASFSRLRDDQVPELAAMVKSVLSSLRRGAKDPDYNLLVQSAPVGEEESESYRWHLVVMPRISTAAGFELGSGMSINCVAPEDAAQAMREAIASVPVR